MAKAFPSDKKYFLVVVADEYRAIFYTRETRSGPLTRLHTITNEPARMKTGELLADRGGRAFDSHGQGRHTMGSEKMAPKDQVARTFGKHVAEIIATEVHKGNCRDFALIAAPRFLGTLRHELSVLTKAEPYMTIDKDVVGRKESFIEDLIARS